MRERRLWGQARGFTLLELLIVVCIIAILVTMVITTLGGARRRAKVAVARSNIQAIKAALAMYESDTGRYPCRQNKAITAPGAVLYNNDIAYAWAALRNRPTQNLQGGPNSPYLDWKPEQIGIPNSGFDSGVTFATNTTENYATPVPPGTWVTELPPGDNNWNLPTNDPNAPSGSVGSGGQAAHLPQSNVPFVFLDPWGNPYWYIEWASVPSSVKDQMMSGQAISSNPIGSSGGTGSGPSESHTLTPHDTSKFDIWSFGPNGVNEAGEGDDVASWTDAAKK